ncbi:MAG TPA: hypothetical protein VHI71_05685 [Actinomycetota bacterium]|nr:hypothetical protein [Actinomycetota bacterium]
MRRSLMTVLAACLLVGGLVAPAEAGKKKKPKKAPVTFEESGSLAVGHPGTVEADGGIARTEFQQSCAIPTSQGTDGYVIALPPEITAVNSNVTLTGADASGIHDVDMYFFDETCAPSGALSTEAPDEFGLMPAGTSYVLVSAYFGVEVTFDFKAEGV